MIQFTCNNVTLSYSGRIAVEGLNFEILEGEYVCVVGENGAGKTTLIKSLLKLKDVNKGTIIPGEGISLQDIGYLPQQTQIQRNFPASVSEIVLSGRLNCSAFKPFYTKTDRLIANQKMEELKIINLRERSYRELSGGQQQRVLLARALCAAKKILLLDEPVAGLDPVATHGMYESIKNINKKGMTIIMVSHDISGALVNASHVLHIANHKQIFFGATAQYKASSAGKRFLGDIND